MEIIAKDSWSSYTKCGRCSTVFKAMVVNITIPLDNIMNHLLFSLVHMLSELNLKRTHCNATAFVVYCCVHYICTCPYKIA